MYISASLAGAATPAATRVQLSCISASGDASNDFMAIASHLFAATAYEVTISTINVDGPVGPVAASLVSAVFSTVEDAPADVPAPLLSAVRARSANVTLYAPLVPNGVVISYEALLDGVSCVSSLYAGKLSMINLVS